MFSHLKFTKLFLFLPIDQENVYRVDHIKEKDKNGQKDKTKSGVKETIKKVHETFFGWQNQKDSLLKLVEAKGVDG